MQIVIDRVFGNIYSESMQNSTEAKRPNNLRKNNLAISLRGLLCSAVLLLWGVSLAAEKLDLGLGIGFFHGTMHSPDPLPVQYGGERFFRDFGSPMPELGIPLSRKLKLSLRAYYHHREYQYTDTGYTGDNVMQHMGQYLDIPLSLNARIQNWDLFAGANAGILLYDFVFDDLTDNPDFYKDAKTFVPGVHAGIRIPWPGTDKVSILAFYNKDLLPFSEIGGRRMYQDRYVLQLMYLILNEKYTQPLVDEGSLEELVHSLIPGLNLAVGFGISRAGLAASPNHALVEEFEYRRTHYHSGLKLGWQATSQFELAAQPNLHWREYKVHEEPYGRIEFSAKAQYLELPLLLKSKLAGMEVYAGPNLSFLQKARYTASHGDIPNDEQKDAKEFLAGLCVGITQPFGKSGRSAVNLFYTKDAMPFSKAYGFDKTQECLKLYLSYELLKSGDQKDLLPADALGKEGIGMSYELGYTRVQIAEYDCAMPFVRYGRIKRSASGWGQGYLFGMGFTKVEDYDGTVYVNRLTAQKRLSFGLYGLELYAAPGLGLDTGAGIRKSHGIMDEGFPILAYGNSMFVWEAGLRLNLFRRFSVIGFAAKQHTAQFKTPLRAGLSLEYLK